MKKCDQELLPAPEIPCTDLYIEYMSKQESRLMVKVSVKLTKADIKRTLKKEFILINGYYYHVPVEFLQCCLLNGKSGIIEMELERVKNKENIPNEWKK